MEKTHSSLLRRIKVLEQHASQGTPPSGLCIKNVKAKGQNVEALQAIDSLRSEVTDCKAPVAECHRDIDGTVAKWQSTLLLCPVLTSLKIKSENLRRQQPRFGKLFF